MKKAYKLHYCVRIVYFRDRSLTTVCRVCGGGRWVADKP